MRPAPTRGRASAHKLVMRAALCRPKTPSRMALEEVAGMCRGSLGVLWSAMFGAEGSNTLCGSNHRPIEAAYFGSVRRSVDGFVCHESLTPRPRKIVCNGCLRPSACTSGVTLTASSHRYTSAVAAYGRHDCPAVGASMLVALCPWPKRVPCGLHSAVWVADVGHTTVCAAADCHPASFPRMALSLCRDLAKH